MKTARGRDREADLLKLADAFFENLEREQHVEYGGWGLDDKRPFGNSSVTSDMIEILGITHKTCSHCGESDYADDAHAYVDELYGDLGDFLRRKWREFRQGA